MHFVSLFSFYERNIATSFLMIDLKRDVVYYANLNASSINKSQFWGVEYPISSF